MSVEPESGRESTTHCPYCALQCSTVLSGERGAVAVRPSAGFPVNRGGLCQKGWTAPALLSTPDRLLTPLVRGADGRLAPAGWDEALDLVAGRLKELRARHGADAVAVFGGGGLTNEKAYTLGKFARVALGTSQIDYNGRFCMSSAAAAATAAFGLDRGLPFPVTDLAGAEVILLAGANPAETMPPLMRHLEGADLVVVDPRRTRTAQQAALHLQPAPGTDLALALGMLHLAVTEGLVDKEYVDERTSGFDAAWEQCVAWWPERVEEVTGVPAADLRTAVRMLGDARRAYVLTGRGAEQHSKGSDTVAAFINLALALGLPGREGNGFGTLTGQGNGQGGREMGQKADQLPGYRSLTDPAARAHMASVWGVAEDALPGAGRSAYELLDALGRADGPRALLVFGSNPVVSAPRAAHVTERLRALDLLVVADFVPSETAALADVVLPVAQWAEEEGTLTSLEGRVLRRRAHLTPPPGVRTDLAVLHALAVRLGQPAARFPTRPREVFDELRRATAGAPADYSGITYDRLDTGEPLHWPCPTENDTHRHNTAGRARDTAEDRDDTCLGPGTGEDRHDTCLGPDTGEGQYDTGEGRDNAGERPDDTRQNPGTGEDRHDTGEGRDNTGERRDGAGEDPDNTCQGPSTGEDRHDTGGRPDDTRQNPDTGEGRDHAGEGRGNTGERRDGAGQRPADTRQDPDTGEDRHDTGEGPNNAGERPGGAAGKQRDAGGKRGGPVGGGRDGGTGGGGTSPHPGTPRLFLDRFAHPEGRARFTPVDHRPAAQEPGGDFPLYGTTGRVLAQYQSGAQTRRVAELLAAAPEAVVEVHPDTARRLGLADGKFAEVGSVYGTVRARVRLTRTVRTDTVFVPFHFPGAARANLFTGDALDPRSRMPEFKVSAVRVTPVGEQP
ncbi:molybdopterin-dependent oxidoreductase [Streptomyces sp. NPDC001137]|uniref:molybdopterin-dependent oxidoreductase n=1 Tax=Streptomyces sp. NPDC001137 TaxID=3154378 RepID=UPI00332F48E6